MRSRRICAVCTGAFALAEIGLLNKCRVVTHWRSCAQLAEEFPEICVDPEPLFIQVGKIWTTAGVTAGIDLSLALIEQDHSAALATSVARRLVVYMKRPDPRAARAYCSRQLLIRRLRGDACSWEGIMLLIVYYLIFVIAGDLADYLIGLIVEREFGSHVSLPIFLALYFVVLWLAWLFAVWMTEPKRARASLHGG